MKTYLSLFVSACLASTQLAYGETNLVSVNYSHQGHEKSLLLSLQEIAKQAGKKLAYDKGILEGKQAAGYDKSLPLEQALAQLLTGSGVAFQLKGNIIVLHQADHNHRPEQMRLQQDLITGHVRDQRTGDPINGATIQAIPGSHSVQTGIDGSFRLPIRPAAEGFVLHISYIGYKTKDFKLTAEMIQQPLTISLQEDLFGLDEVVVTGQGLDINKRRLSTNVATVSGKELEKVPASRFDQLLQSKLPNAQIRLTGGQSGATSIIRARGVVSAFKNSTPVIYVDGVRMDNLNTASAIGGGSAQGSGVSSIADIPIDNIERVEYVNGGAATTLYGSDAANGVIQIFTKKGGADRTTVTAEATIGAERATTDFLHFKRTEELLFEPGTFQRYNVAVNGNSGKVGYSVTGAYLNSSGVQLFKQNENKRVDLRSGFRADLHEKVAYESSFTFVNNSYKRNRNGNQGGYTGLWYTESGASAVSGPQPRFNPRIDDLSEDEFAKMKEYVQTAERLQDNEIVVNRFQTSQSFQYRPLPNLNIKAVGGVDYRVLRNQVIQTNEYLTHTTGNLTTDRGSINNGERKYWGLTMELNGQHKANIGELSVITTLGGQLFRNEDRQVAYNGINIRDGARNIADAASKTSNEVYLEVVNYGMYLQSNLGWKNKLFLDLGLRGDGNSAFGRDIGIQYYPKIGFSYIPSSESWWTEFLPFIPSAKLRGNYGVAGNFPPPFRNLRTMNFPSYLGDQAAIFGTPGVNLRPEKTNTLEAGLDLGLWDDRVTLSAGFYHAITNDALFSVPAAPSTAENEALRNVGKIMNRGLEFNTQVTALRTEHTSLRFNLAINTLDNKVLSSNGAAPFNIAGFSERTIQTVVQEGYPVGFIRGGYGIFGDDGVLEQTIPLQYLGTTIPNLFGSMGVDLQWKGLNLYANADYQKGAYANNWDSQFRYNYGAGDEGIPAGEINSEYKRTRWLQFTNMFIEKTDFIKIRTIGAAYTLPRSAIRSFAHQAVIGASIMNPFNFTSSSFDPEATISGSAAGQDGATTGGISYATYSVPRQFLMSIKLSF
ncbi:outer membrane receptor protein involved in Fe transport [Sphingobacterium allocomposti]|uniref:Outer membrane receptor protein involved in Fe transport n=1 Tax=Sphingobacterium allocomposti TaxID=415956 RepID=A0A5S5D9X2_9SPHI|nr:TonB-dependent receptor [Sphingobacterium composti Yoo et al. 2007 non Ten et al. 2007]TYP92314.1 outer membrane receptor protein involved in Fe transport [Sphingobacterium composti Yoo et al. 2007 non Ten et al. 2007]